MNDFEYDLVKNATRVKHLDKWGERVNREMGK